MFGINLVYWNEKIWGEINPPETSEILAENAKMKAQFGYNQHKMLTLADDSGIFIEGIDYFPGVHSRRWAGEYDDDQYRNEKILELMKGNQDRKAYLISRFSLCNSSGEIFKTVVKNEFSLATEIHGNGGFGYDSLLLPTELSVCNAVVSGRLDGSRMRDIIGKRLSIADLSQEEKNAINNRGRIAKEIAEFLKNNNFYN